MWWRRLGEKRRCGSRGVEHSVDGARAYRAQDRSAEERVSKKVCGSAGRLANCIRCILLPIAVAFFGPNAFGATSETDQVAKAREAFLQGDCESAWNMVWPLAKGGSQRARY